MKVKLEKNEKTLRKERIEAKKKDTKEPTLKEIKELLLDILEEVKEG